MPGMTTVGEDHLEAVAVGGELGERGFRIADEHAVVAQRLERVGGELPDAGVVLHHEDADALSLARIGDL